MNQDGCTRAKEATGLFSLPIELRECIYECYLASLHPTTFTIVKDASKQQWTLLTSKHRRSPALLLACKAISAEISNVMDSLLFLSPGHDIPLSNGPTIRIEPRRIMTTWISSTADATERMVEHDDLPGLFAPILLENVPSLQLHLVMPQDPADAVLFISMIRYIAAVCNARSLPLKQLRAVRDPVSGPGWAADVNAIMSEVGRIQCAEMVWKNWYRQWYAADGAAGGGSRSDHTTDRTGGQSVEDAWASVLESCREYGRA